MSGAKTACVCFFVAPPPRRGACDAPNKWDLEAARGNGTLAAPGLGEPSAQEALLSGLPSHVGAQTLAPDGLLTSVARACHEAYGRPSVLDSRELPGGLSACADWAAAVKAGLNSVHAATAPLNAGHVTVVRKMFECCMLSLLADELLRRYRASCKCTLAREADRR